jgi:hypothetical protein
VCLLLVCLNCIHVLTATASGSELLPPPPLAYKKWSFGEQEQVVDHASCGEPKSSQNQLDWSVGSLKRSNSALSCSGNFGMNWLWQLDHFRSLIWSFCHELAGKLDYFGWLIFCFITGLIQTNLFDQLHARTVNSSVGPVTSATHLYVTTGTGPFVGFFNTTQVCKTYNCRWTYVVPERFTLSYIGQVWCTLRRWTPTICQDTVLTPGECFKVKVKWVDL